TAFLLWVIALEKNRVPVNSISNGRRNSAFLPDRFMANCNPGRRFNSKMAESFNLLMFWAKNAPDGQRLIAPIRDLARLAWHSDARLIYWFTKRLTQMICATKRITTDIRQRHRQPALPKKRTPDAYC